MIEISRKELHLAAYLKSHGADFVDFKNDCFIFESRRTESTWRVEHSNSCCLKTDVELFALKRFL